MMKTKFLSLSIFCWLSISSMTLAQGSFEWINATPNASSMANDGATIVRVDALGNSYVAGVFGGSITFGSTTLVARGSSEVFLCKYNKYGIVQWAKRIGGPEFENITDIHVDGAGNCYITGYFVRRIYIDIVQIDDTSMPYNNTIFVTKLDIDGNVIWARKDGGNDIEESYTISVDQSGNYYIGGLCGPTSLFGDATEYVGGNGQTAFLTKYDQQGNIIWFKPMLGDGLYENISALRLDRENNVYAAGRFGDRITIDAHVLSATGPGLFLAKFDSVGRTIWTNAIDGNLYPYKITLDQAGDLYVMGDFLGEVTFGSTLYKALPEGTSYTDIFLTKYKNDGSFTWAKAIGGDNQDSGRSVLFDKDNNFYLTGFFSGVVNFEGTTVEAIPNSEFSETDFFIAKYNSVGVPNWVQSFPSSNIYGFADAAFIDNERLFMAGAFSDTILVNNEEFISKAPFSSGNVLMASFNVNGNNQLVYIPDDNFRQCLKETHPQIFDSNDFVIRAEAEKIDRIYCYDKGIESIVGIDAFVNVVNLNFTLNKIKAIPSIASLIKVTSLEFPYNEITVLPDLSANTNLEYLTFYVNRIATFPNLQNNLKVKLINFLDNQIVTIPDLSHLKDLTHLAIGENPIVTFPSLDQNLELIYLQINKTQLTTFPKLLKNLKLETLYFGQNPQFSEWPEISSNINLRNIGCDENNLSSIPPLDIYPHLRFLSCSKNRLHSLPDLSMHYDLIVLYCSSNNLSSLPDLSQTRIGKSLIESQLDVSENNLTFEDLIPLTKSTLYARLVYDSQTLPLREIAAIENVGAIFKLNIEIDKPVTDNIYTWYHNGVIVATTTTNSLSITDLKQSDSGIYHCEVTNVNVPNLRIVWRRATLEVTLPCQTPTLSTTDFDLQITPATCTSGGLISLKENGNGSLVNTTFKMEEVNSGLITASNLPEIEDLIEGEYILTLIQNGCSREWPERLIVIKDSNCDDPVISPNQDGILDNYLIPFQGTAKIYDRSGLLVKQLSIPAIWDGTDDSGTPLPMGTYIIRCANQKDVLITVVK